MPHRNVLQQLRQHGAIDRRDEMVIESRFDRCSTVLLLTESGYGSQKRIWRYGAACAGISPVRCHPAGQADIENAHIGVCVLGLLQRTGRVMFHPDLMSRRLRNQRLILIHENESKRKEGV